MNQERSHKMNFGEALTALKQGERVSRDGWNGRGMFLFLNPGSTVTVAEGRPLAAHYPVGSVVTCLPYIMLKGVGIGPVLVPWLASQTDLLADRKSTRLN